jgi:ketosteroid isomerase-like protein
MTLPLMRRNMSATETMKTPKQVVAGMYDAFARGDVSTVLGALAADVRWCVAENFPYSDRNPYTGPDAVVRGVFMRLATEWDGYAVNRADMIGEADRVVVTGRYTGTYRATGLRVDAQFVHVWTFRNGQVAAFQQYTDTLQFARVTGAK